MRRRLPYYLPGGLFPRAPALADAKKYFLALGKTSGSPGSTNVMYLGVRGRDRWGWGTAKYLRKINFPPQGGGGN